MGCNGDVLAKTKLWLDTIFLFGFFVVELNNFQSKEDVSG